MVAKTAADRLQGSAASQEVPCPPCEVPKGHFVFTDDDWRRISDSLGLSDREFEIVQGIFDNDTELAIAERLGISCHTVHTHIGRLYHKLDVRGRCELVVRVFAQYVLLSTSQRDSTGR